MNDPTKLIPPEIESPTQSYKRVGVAFGDRFFMLLFVGLVWLGPAFFDHRFVYAMLGRDILVLLAWIVDLTELPRPSQLAVRRSWRNAAALSIESEIDLTLINSSRKNIRVILMDSPPAQLRSEPPSLTVNVAGSNALGKGEAQQ